MPPVPSVPPAALRHVRQTWPALAAPGPQTAARFFDNLFIADPTLVPFFSGDICEQGERLMDMLDFVVRDLDDPERFRDAFRALGRRHTAYGVRPAHYRTFGDALIRTLAQSLGDRFTPEVRAAWTTVYEAMVAHMTATDDGPNEEGATSGAAPSSRLRAPRGRRGGG